MKTEFAATSAFSTIASVATLATVAPVRTVKPLVMACMLATAAILGLSSAAPAQAQVAVSISVDSNIASQEWADPPGRVGRLSYLSGDVSFFGDNQEGWSRGRLNYPVSNENSVWTGRGGRAEFRVGAQAVRVDEETVLDVLNMTDNATVLFLQRGAVNVRVRDFSRSDSFWIDTAEGRFAIRGNGRFRVEINAQTGETRFTVFSGSARVEGDGVQRGLERATTLSVRGGNIADSRYERSFETGFDRWAYNRDRDDDFTYSRVVRDRVVSPYMTGYEDLNANGDWIDDNEYGRIWAPRITIASWAPYRYGHWTYARRWGWTWVDDAAWGFAPFHYGRWLFTSNRWCWSPGSYVHRPVYAPALVGWHGNFSHSNSNGHHDGRGHQHHGRDPFSNALNGRGAVGWFPLSPNDRFAPSYTSNQNYVRNVNSGWAGRPTSPSNAYQNQTPGATFVARDVFLSAAPINTQATISAADIMRGGVAANGFGNTMTTAAPTLLPGRFRGSVGSSGNSGSTGGSSGGTGFVNAPAQPFNPGNVQTPAIPAANSGSTGGITGGRPTNSQPTQPAQTFQPFQPAQPQPQQQPQIQPQQPQQPVGRPSAADIMRGGVSLTPAQTAPAVAPAAAAPSFGNMGSRPAPQQANQPVPQPVPQPMPLPGREVFNPGNQGSVGASGGRFVPSQPAVQTPQPSVNQPSAPVYSRPGYVAPAAPAVSPNQNSDTTTGFRRGSYGAQQQGIFVAPQRPSDAGKVEIKAEPKPKAAKVEREAKSDEPKQNDNRGPNRGRLEKQQ